MTGLAKSPGIRYADNYISARNNSTLSSQIYCLLFLIITLTSLRPTLLRLFHLFRQVSQTFHRPLCSLQRPKGTKEGRNRGEASSLRGHWPKVRGSSSGVGWLIRFARSSVKKNRCNELSFPTEGLGLRALEKAKWKGPATRYLRVIPNTSELSYVGNVP